MRPRRLRAALAAGAAALLCGTGPALAGGFERLDPEGAAAYRGLARPLVVREADGRTLEASGDTLVRARYGPGTPSRTRVPCTLQGGPGVIHALASDPLGITYVAAERGLFMISPEVDALDPVELQDGAPPGVPLAIVMDARRRLWIATDQAFGCVDPVMFFGRTFGAADSVPDAKAATLGADRDGSLILVTDEGVYRYRPDAGEPPAIHSILANGEPAAAGSTIPLAPGAPFEIRLEGSALGGVTFRHRWDDRLPLRPADGGTILRRGLAPGHRRIEIVALDRDLNATPVRTLHVKVGWPLYWSPPVVLALGALTGLGFAGIRFAWPAGGDHDARRRAFLSAVLALGIGLQLLAAAVPHARGWPLVGFSMYTGLYEPGDLALRFVIEGLGPGGERRKIQAEDTRLDYLEWHIVRPLATGGARAGSAFVAWYNRLHPDRPISGVEARMYRWRLSREGPVPVAPIILAHYEEDDAIPGTVGSTLVR